MGATTSTDLTYAVPLTNTSNEGQSFVYRNPDTINGLVDAIQGLENATSYKDVVLNSFQKFANNKLHGTREVKADGTLGEYRWKTYREVSIISKNVGAGILEHNLAPSVSNEQDKIVYKPVGIYSKNREEWLQVDYASVLYGFCLIPLYDTLGPDVVEYIHNQSKFSTIFCATNYLDKLLAQKKKGQLKDLQAIAVFDDVTEDQRAAGAELGVKIFTFKQLQEDGAKNADKHPYAELNKDDLYTICYTSGTTGDPKGVMVTHRNILSLIAGVEAHPDYLMKSTDIYLSFLPLAHTMERSVSAVMLSRGAAIGYYGGDTQKLKEDFPVLKPTILVLVPRILSRIYNAFQAEIAKVTGVKRTLLDRAIKVKLENFRKHGLLTHKIYDTLVFKKMRELFGGNVRLMLTGSAPIEPQIIDFLRIAVSCVFTQGYGQTESNAASFLTKWNDPNSSVVGVVKNLEFKVVDIPDMNYTSKDVNEKGVNQPRGEICMRGNTVFKGYYRNPDKTAEAIDSEGWLHTGDIGMVFPNGSIKIIDRKKNLFKLAQGEYVAPEKIENILAVCELVAEVFVHGDSLKTYCIGIIFPSEGPFKKFAAGLEVNGTLEELCANEKVKTAYLAKMAAISKEKGLNSLETIKGLYLTPVSFATKDLLTPSLKVKRHDARLAFAAEIKAIYDAKPE